MDAETASLARLIAETAGETPSRLSVHNPPLNPPGVPFAFQDYSNPALRRFRRKYRLDEIVSGAATDLEKVLRLRNWVHEAIPQGPPVHDRMDPFAILDAASEGGTFHCTHYAFVFVCCALSLGLAARKLGVDRYHEPDEDSWHHGVAEVYVHDLDKWMVADAMFDIHFELGGVPLNALEIREAVLSGGKRRIKALQGPSAKPYRPKKTARRFDSPDCYFWSFVESGNDYFSIPAPQGGRRKYILRDRHNKSRVWYQGPGSKGESRPHRGYAGSFIDVEHPDALYPSVGRSRMEVSPGDGALRVRALTWTPSFSRFEWTLDGKAPARNRSDTFEWRLHRGRNSLAVRSVNTAGVRGHPAEISFFV